MAPGTLLASAQSPPSVPNTVEGHLAALAKAAGAPVIINNQAEFNGAADKLRMLADRQPGERRRLDLGADAVARYFTGSRTRAQRRSLARSWPHRIAVAKRVLGLSESGHLLSPEFAYSSEGHCSTFANQRKHDWLNLG